MGRSTATTGSTIVGVHTPEFPFEQDAGERAGRDRQNGLQYPVAQDNDYATWNAYGNQYWPADYLIDARGKVRYVHFGEGDYAQTEQRSAAARGGGRRPAAPPAAAARAPLRTSDAGDLPRRGASRGLRERPSEGGAQTLRRRTAAADRLAYRGTVGHRGRGRRPRPRASCLAFRARRVFFALGTPPHPRRVRVLLDGRRSTHACAGPMCTAALVSCAGSGCTVLVELPRPGATSSTLDRSQGAGYAFTFG